MASHDDFIPSLKRNVKKNRKTGEYETTPAFVKHASNPENHEYILVQAQGDVNAVQNKMDKLKKKLDEVMAMYNATKAVVDKNANEHASKEVKVTLTEAQVKRILDNAEVNDAKQRKALTSKLIKLKYDSEYGNCYNGKLGRPFLYDQAHSKLECWLKYGDKFW